MSNEVTYSEPFSIKVGKLLLSEGFDLASCTGFAKYELVEDNSLGILCKNLEAKPKKYLFGLIKKEPRKIFFGTVWFNNSARGANEENWVFEVYGRKYIGLVRELAEDMALTFNVDISIRLVQEQPDFESRPCDFSCD
jgi:hypothetical protein